MNCPHCNEDIPVNTNREKMFCEACGKEINVLDSHQAITQPEESAEGKRGKGIASLGQLGIFLSSLLLVFAVAFLDEPNRGNACIFSVKVAAISLAIYAIGAVFDI